MRLLFDQNLSHRLVTLLDDLFPESLHVRHVSLESVDDSAIWEYAKVHNLVIVTQDSDFADWNKVHGVPPRIIWLRCGNSTVDQIHHKLRSAAIRTRLASPDGEHFDVLEIW